MDDVRVLRLQQVLVADVRAYHLVATLVGLHVHHIGVAGVNSLFYDLQEPTRAPTISN